MKTYAFVGFGRTEVVRIRELPDDEPMPEGGVLHVVEVPVQVEVELGFRYDADTGIFTDPLPPAPERVTNYQFRAALMRQPSTTKLPGRTLFQDADLAFTNEGGEAHQAWEYAPHVTRSGPVATALTARFGLKTRQLDALFRTAAEIAA